MADKPIKTHQEEEAEMNQNGIFEDEEMEMIDKESDDESLVNVAMFPIGIVLSVKSNEVIVESKEKFSHLLIKGSFLWLSETRVPLGYVDDKIFGTLEKPCYSVRLELENQVISQGTQVSVIVEDGDDDAEKKMEKFELKTGTDSQAKTATSGLVTQNLPLTRPNSELKTGTVICSDSQASGLVHQHLPLPKPSSVAAVKKAETNQQSKYQHPMSKLRAKVSNPVPIHQAPTWMMPMPMPIPNPMIYQPYPNTAVAPWPQMQQPTPSSDRGRGLLQRHRGAGRGFNRSYGRGRSQDPKQERW